MTESAVVKQAISTPSQLVGTQWPAVGVGIYILRDGKVLMGRRSDGSTHASDTWCPPGGNLNFGESIEECARREVREETGLEVANIRVGTITNDIFADEGRHYVSIAVLAEYVSGEPQVLEPTKMDHWEWFFWDDIVDLNLLLSTKNLLRESYSPFNKPMMVGLKALIKNEEGHYLLFHRRHPRPGESNSIWEIPGGRMESGEEVPDALKREVKAETGLTVTTIGRCIGVQSILKNPKQHVVRNTFEVEVTGDLKSFGENDEHDEAQWFSLEQIGSLTLDPYLAEVFEGLRKEAA